MRLKDDFDGATPTASSQGALQFLKLAEMTGREEFRKIAEKSMRSVTAVIKRSPYAMPEMMSVAEMELGDGPRLVLACMERLKILSVHAIGCILPIYF